MSEQYSFGAEGGFYRGGKQIQSVQKAINILNCFTTTNTALTLGQISSRLNLNKGTVHGILNTLRINGYVSQNSLGQYMLGAELFNKACLAQDTRQKICIDQAHDLMHKLSNRFQSNCSLFVIDDLRLKMLDATEPTNSAFIVRRAAPEISLYGSASGKLLLAHQKADTLKLFFSSGPFPAFTPSTKNTRQKLMEELPLILERGYSLEEDELFMGISAIAVPVYSGYQNQLFGTLSLTGMSVSIMKAKREIVRALTDTARQIGDKLQF